MTRKNSGNRIAIRLLSFITMCAATLSTFSHANSQPVSRNGQVFSRKNLVAWCIVPFDNKNRTPEERAQMLVKLGISKFAYDWREVHVPYFDREMDAIKKYHIKLQAFWMPYGPDPVLNVHYKEILALLKRHGIKTQLWWSYGSEDDALKNLSQQEKVRTVGEMAAAIAKDAAEIGCTVGLYGHGGWFGEPENELSILQYVKMKNLGIVYNFNHAEDQVAGFSSFFPKIIPHLIALNIAGLKKGPPGKVVAVGQGDSEMDMIRIIAESSYRGPIGIINEDTDPDAEIGLEKNINGLRNILHSLGYVSALATYNERN